MPGFIFLLLPLSIIFVFALAALAFADVAFRQVPVLERSIGAGVPLSGGRLLAREIAAVQRVVTTAPETDASSAVSCSCESFIPMVTEPEATVIAQELQGRATELQQVRARLTCHKGACPMRSDSGVCACAVARPISCIGRCTAGEDAPEWMKGLGDTVFAAFRNHLEDRHLNAHTRRLDEALGSLLNITTDSAV